mmetsp:Transcript_88007/g.222131  ORF Transcript_88007/g.222131 Transcript_88007/m.222131 type:complete len:945 (+) Transcript_88007:79-2913(+)
MAEIDEIDDPLVEGLRPGCLVEVTSPPEDAPRLGQLISFDREANKFNVVLVDGEATTADPKCVKAAEGIRKPGQGGAPDSFDVLLSPRTPDGLIGEELAACLFEKGFCVLRLCNNAVGLEGAVETVRSMGDDGRLVRLPEEVEEGYLGVNGRGKVFWMDNDAIDMVQDDVLESNDQTFSYLASLIQPFSADAVGKPIEERTPALVSLSLSDMEEDDYPQPMADDRTLGDFLGTWRRGALRAVHFMGPPTAEVLLESRDTDAAAALQYKQEAVSIEAPPNTILIFRTDCYTYESHASGELLTMMATFLAQGQIFYIDTVDGDLSALRGLCDGAAPPGGEVVNVKHHASKLAARWDSGEMLNTGLQAGTDTVVEIPIVRFDVNAYFCPDPAELMSGPPRTVQRHTSFVDGMDLFDHRYFEISRNEATGMDPLQRAVLDVGNNLLNAFGISKADSNRTAHHAGCAVGVDKSDYPTLPNLNQGGCNAYAIIANRFSFVFNMKGPNYVSDTACSASLTATHSARLNLLHRQWDPLEFHLVFGTHLCLSPGPWIGCSYSQMVSPEGRCFTFNASANGYLRGEGTSGILLTYNGDSDRQAIVRSTSLGQDGRSASLTAPNGPSQEEMIWRAIREARMVPAETSSWECHGTGTSLGDPIEVGAVRRVQLKGDRQEPLMMSTMKSNIGHLEGGAAMGGILRAIREVMHTQCFPSNHLKQLNAHLESAAFDAWFASELSSFRHEQGHAQVSSFGFGGSNGHGIFWGREALETIDPEGQVLRRLAKMRQPEVRPVGQDPDDWESDWPDADAKPGERWMITFTSDDPKDAAIKWVKDYSVEGGDEDEEDVQFAIAGNFNDWDAEPMAAGSVPGQAVVTLTVPAGGELEFYFLRDGDPDQAIYPRVPKCTRKSEQILGPGKIDKTRHCWVIKADAGTDFQVELICIGGRYSVLWVKA